MKDSGGEAVKWPECAILVHICLVGVGSEINIPYRQMEEVSEVARFYLSRDDQEAYAKGYPRKCVYPRGVQLSCECHPAGNNGIRCVGVILYISVWISTILPSLREQAVG